jgi:pimeloyl-ACP methyl ester carboxylesterase
VFTELAERLASKGFRVVAPDLRGHGDSGREPPWNTETHVADLLETVAALNIRDGIWIGHSFGGLLSATLGARVPEQVEGLVLLDPGFAIDPGYALRSAEMDRLDWSFATADGAVNALLSSDFVVAAPREVVAAYVADDLERGSDGRFRFRHSPSAAVVAWSETTLPPPPIAQLPTLLVRPVSSAAGSRVQDARYRTELGPLLTLVAVPNGHNVLWESPLETMAAIDAFLAEIDSRALSR